MRCRLVVFICIITVSFCYAAKESPYEQILAMHDKGQTTNQLMTWCENSSKATGILTFQEIRKLANENYPLEFIECLLQKAAQFPEITDIIKYENHSFWLSGNMRGYFKPEKDRLKLVITNLDEYGARLGGEVPLEEQLAQKKYFEERYAKNEAAYESAPAYPTYVQPSLQEQPQQAKTEYVYVPYTHVYPVNPWIEVDRQYCNGPYCRAEKTAEPIWNTNADAPPPPPAPRRNVEPQTTPQVPPEGQAPTTTGGSHGIPSRDKQYDRH